MTSADDFVLQLIQDKGLVPPDIIKLGREQLVSEGVPPTDIDSKLIDLIVDKRYCKYEDITYLLSQEFNIPLISLQDIRVDESVLKLLPQDILRKYNVFPISSSGGQLELAISDPMDMDSVDDISHILNMSVDLRLARGNKEGHRRPLRGKRIRRRIRRRDCRAKFVCGGRQYARDRQRSGSVRGGGPDNKVCAQADN